MLHVDYILPLMMLHGIVDHEIDKFDLACLYMHAYGNIDIIRGFLYILEQSMISWAYKHGSIHLYARGFIRV